MASHKSKNRRTIEYAENSQTLIGQKRKRLIDTETGEEIEVDQITKVVYGSKNFWKCYLMDFLTALGMIDSRQLDVLLYILENTRSSDNLFIGTYDKIMKDVECSRQTIATAMKKLQDQDLIKRVQNGVWQINPNIMVKGSDKKREMLLSYYQSDEPLDKMHTNKVIKRRNTTKSIKKDVSTDNSKEDPKS